MIYILCISRTDTKKLKRVLFGLTAMAPSNSYSGPIYTIAFTSEDFWLALLAFLFPPIPVILRAGLFSKDSLLNVLLLMCFYFPAVLHSCYVVYQTSPARGQQQRDHEGSAGARLLNESSREGLDLEAHPVPFNTTGGSGEPHPSDSYGPPGYDEVGNTDRYGTSFPMDNKVQR